MTNAAVDDEITSDPELYTLSVDGKKFRMGHMEVGHVLAATQNGPAWVNLDNVVWVFVGPGATLVPTDLDDDELKSMTVEQVMSIREFTEADD